MSKRPQDTSAEEPDGGNPHIRFRGGPRQGDRTGLLNSHAIIGFGKIGQALATAFARGGIEVSVATTRDPESFASAAAAIGPTIIPKKLAEAVKADIVFLAVRFESH